MSQISSSNGAEGQQVRPPDGFVLQPLYVALGAWLFTVAPIVYEPGNLFFPVTFIPGFFILPILALIWLIFFVVAVFRLHWKRVLAFIIAVLGFAAAAGLTLIFTDEIRFWTLSPYYFTQVARLVPAANGLRNAHFGWRGGFGWDVQLVYDEADTITASSGETLDSCTRIVRRMYKHFYLDEWFCH